MPREWRCLKCNFRMRAVKRPPACGNVFCRAKTHEDDLKGAG